MRIRMSFALLVVMLIGGMTSAQEMKDHKLTVYGKVRVFAKADRATMRFDIKGVGNTLNAAFDNARLKLDSIATRLYAVGLQKTDLSTSFFRNEENFGDKAFLSSKKDFRAVMTVTIATRQLELLEQITIILSEGSIERIQSVEFDLVNYRQLRNDAIQQAAEAAKEKAEIAAKSMGVTCGETLEFEELRAQAVESDNSWPKVVRARRDIINPFNRGYYAAGVVGLDQTDGVFYAQDFEFEAEVKVTFAIVGSSAKNTDSAKRP